MEVVWALAKAGMKVAYAYALAPPVERRSLYLVLLFALEFQLTC